MKTKAALPSLARVPGDFGYTEEHGMLATSARRFLAQNWGAERLRRFVEGATGMTDPVDPDGLSEAMAELGWFDMVLEVERGGGGLGWLHAALLGEELGRVLSPIRWAPRLLATYATGDTEGRGTICFDASEAVAEGDSLSGRHARVPGGMAAGYLLAPARRGESQIWLSISLDAGVERLAHRVQDPTRPCADLRYASGDTTATDYEGDGPRSPRSLELRAWLLHAAEGVGAAETVLGMTRDYAVDRQQFGRPIGSFQAVSHPIVDTMIAIERARSLVYAAAAALDEGGGVDGIEPLARMAKIAADDALWDAASRGVQLHGGFGFTWDCDVHFYLRRAMSARAELGSTAEHRQELARMLLG